MAAGANSATTSGVNPHSTDFHAGQPPNTPPRTFQPGRSYKHLHGSTSSAAEYHPAPGFERERQATPPPKPHRPDSLYASITASSTYGALLPKTTPLDDMRMKVSTCVSEASLSWQSSQESYPFVKAQASEAATIHKLIQQDPKGLQAAHSLRYFFHLKDLAGLISQHPVVCQQSSCVVKQAENMEGWFASDFLPMRIGTLFKIAVKINSQRMVARELPLEKSELLEHLVREIAIEMQTYHIAMRTKQLGIQVQQYRQASTAAEGQVIQAKYSALLKNFHTEIFPALFEAILALRLGEELTIPSGSLNHCVYVTCWRFSESHLGIRIDNAGLWSDKYHPQSEDKKSVRPYVVTLLPLNARATWEAMLTHYLSNLFYASSRSDEEAEKLIYDHPFTKLYAYEQQTLQAITKDWSAEMESQNVGNCVVKSHQIGLQRRLGFFLASWLREQEISIAAVEL